MRVAVFGASGFVGATLVEQLLALKDVEVRPFIHSYGNAWRLSRAGIALHTVDIMSPSDVASAITGCTHVVNCTRGSTQVMIEGLNNLLQASKAAQIRRLVHVSSVAVYGDMPPPESEREEAPTNPVPGSYGAEKLQQDEMIARAAATGLDSVIICPPNISGVYSGFVSNVLDDIRAGRFALVDGGSRPLNVIDVDNLAYAIICGLRTQKGDARRIFVSDGTGLTWKDLADQLAPLAEGARLATIAGSAVTVPGPPVVARGTLWRTMKHLVSSDVRAALRSDPLLAKLDRRMRRLAALGGRNIEDRLRYSIEGAVKVGKVPDENPYSSRYIPMQMRGVWHRIDRARAVIGYEPPLSFAASMERFRVWYATMNGFGQPYWRLAKLLDTIG